MSVTPPTLSLAAPCTAPIRRAGRTRSSMISALGLAFLLFLGLAAAGFAASEGATAPAPKLIAVKYHADWCGSCKKMGPVFEDLRDKYDGEPVLFVTLDRTNRTTRSQADFLAASLGIGDSAARHAGTGFVVVYDATHRTELAKLTADQDIKAMGAALRSHLDG